MNTELRDMYLEKANQLGMVDVNHMPTNTLIKEVDYASRSGQERGTYQQTHQRWALVNAEPVSFNSYVDIPVRG